MKRDPVRASVLATKIIPNVAPDMACLLYTSMGFSPAPLTKT